MRDYDVVVIGAGPAGCACAEKTAALGLRTALVEKNCEGGTCLHRGCIPTKALAEAARVYRQRAESDFYGVICAEAALDEEKVTSYRDNMVSLNYQALVRRLKKSGVTCLKGEAFVENHREINITYKNRECHAVTAEAIVLAVGTEEMSLGVPGENLPGVVTSEGLLTAPFGRPSTMAIIGGGVVGLELAGIYASFGTQVTILERAPTILAYLDEDVRRHAVLSLRKQGIVCETQAQVRAFTKDGEAVRIAYEDKDGFSRTLSVEQAVIAAGRCALTKGVSKALGLREIKGHYAVDAYGRTSVSGVYAIGDAASDLQLATVAAAMGEQTAAAVYGDIKGTAKAVGEVVFVSEPPAKCSSALPSEISSEFSSEISSGVSSVLSSAVTSGFSAEAVAVGIHTMPEIAYVGLSEKAASAGGRAVICGKSRFDRNSMALIKNKGEGLMKLVFDRETHSLLGAQIVGDGAALLIGELALAVKAKLTGERLASVIRLHPSLAELVDQALQDAGFERHFQ